MPSTQLRHCVVIGAGILGASVAARLAGSGVRVTLLDQGEPGRATSRRSFAWLNSNDKSPRSCHDLNQGRVVGLRTAPGVSPQVRTAAGAVLTADDVICCAGRRPAYPGRCPAPLGR